MSLSEEDLARLESLAAEATPGPWEWREKYDRGEQDLGGFFSGDFCVCHFGNDEHYYPTEGKEPTDSDVRFIAAARAAVLALVSDLRDSQRRYAEITRRYEATTNTAHDFAGRINVLEAAEREVIDAAEAWYDDSGADDVARSVAQLRLAVERLRTAREETRS